MTSFDIAAIIDELHSMSKGSRITKIYHLPDTKTVLLRLRARHDLLVLQAARRVCFTQYEVPVPRKPSQFAMGLRKEIQGGIIEGISQLGFDRIVSVSVRSRGRTLELIVELLPRGNILLTENKIIKYSLFRKVMRDRRIGKGQRYMPPPANTLHPEELGIEDIAAILSKDTIGRALAKRLGYGPPYADEICIRAGTRPDEVASTIDASTAERILEAVKEVYRMSRKHESPRLYRDSTGTVVGISSFDLLTYSNYVAEPHETMNRLVDDYFVELEAIERQMEKEKARLQKEGRREMAVERLRQTAVEMLDRAEKLREDGQIIFTNLNDIKEIVDAARAGRAARTHGAAKMLCVERGKKKKVKIEISGRTLELPISIDASKSASSFFQEAKQLEEDHGKILKKIEAREKQKEEKEKVSVAIPKKRREKAWFESYRWFVSSDKILVVCGKDASTNEALVRKHANPDNPVFHADVTGAPFVLVLSDFETTPQTTLEEAAQMAASHTTWAWQAGYASLDVFWVRASQLKKSPPSGEFLPTGAFVVKGKKNYIKGSRLALAVGAAAEDGLRIVAGPVNAIANRTTRYVRIVPGTTKRKRLAQEVKARLLELAPKSEKDGMKSIRLEEILAVVPGKGGRVI